MIPKGATNPPARRDHSLTLDRDRGVLYLYGGRTGGFNAFADLWAFDLKTETWSQVAVSGPQPKARFGHNAFYDAARKRLVITLGQDSPTGFFNDVWAFDPASASWTQLGAGSAAMPQVRYGAGGAYDPQGSRFLVSHGFTNQGRFDDTWGFDLGGGVWQPTSIRGAAPEKRCLTRSLWEPGSGRLLMFGGQSNSSPFLGDFWSLDPVTGLWTEKRPATLPAPRHLYGASFDEHGRRWYLVGGNTNNGLVADTWVYDTAKDAWSRLEVAAGNAFPARSGLDIAVAGDKLYLFGGNNGSADLDDTWMLPLPG